MSRLTAAVLPIVDTLTAVLNVAADYLESDDADGLVIVLALVLAGLLALLVGSQLGQLAIRLAA